eukprot:SAG11_NODE_4886_length_1733_cov_2.243574_1_plen_164_part_00
MTAKHTLNRRRAHVSRQGVIAGAQSENTEDPAVAYTQPKSAHSAQTGVSNQAGSAPDQSEQRDMQFRRIDAADIERLLRETRNSEVLEQQRAQRARADETQSHTRAAHGKKQPAHVGAQHPEIMRAQCTICGAWEVARGYIISSNYSTKKVLCLSVNNKHLRE